MFACLSDIQRATREELIDYLESWSIACYDNEPTGFLRVAAVDTFKIEGC